MFGYLDDARGRSDGTPPRPPCETPLLGSSDSRVKQVNIVLCGK